MSEQIFEILKFSSLIIFNLFFITITIVALIILRISLKLSKLHKTFKEDYTSVVNDFKTKVSELDSGTIEMVSSITAGIIHGFKKPKESKSFFGIGKKIIKVFFK